LIDQFIATQKFTDPTSYEKATLIRKQLLIQNHIAVNDKRSIQASLRHLLSTLLRRPAAEFAPASYAVVLADARSAAEFAPASLAVVLAEARS
jgi:hypothetical protein